MICSFCKLEGDFYAGVKICKACYRMKRYYDGTLKCSTERYEQAVEYIKEYNPGYLKDLAFDIEKLTDDEICSMPPDKFYAMIRDMKACGRYTREEIQRRVALMEDKFL